MLMIRKKKKKERKEKKKKKKKKKGDQRSFLVLKNFLKGPGRTLRMMTSSLMLLTPDPLSFYPKIPNLRTFISESHLPQELSEEPIFQQTDRIIPIFLSSRPFIIFNFSPALRNKRPGLWTVLKNNIGKELSKISIPIQFNEPLSALQKWCEELEYADLLDTAANASDPLVSLKSFSSSSSNITYSICSTTFETNNRKGLLMWPPFIVPTIQIPCTVFTNLLIQYWVKPLNVSGGFLSKAPFSNLATKPAKNQKNLSSPIAYKRDDIGEGFRFLGEQVSHHPPVSACHSIGVLGWEYSTTLDVTSGFRGKDMEIYPQGISHVRFPNGDHITYKRVTTCVRNIIVGKMWVDNVAFPFFFFFFNLIPVWRILLQPFPSLSSFPSESLVRGGQIPKP